MNLNKFTKAELISKFRKIESKSIDSNKIKTYFKKILSFILLSKNFLFKITLISLLIKYFKRFRILRRLWLILNTVVMSIFGISLIDNFGLGFITSFLNEIRNITYLIIDYLSNTKFYVMLTELFSNKIETPTKQKEINPRDGSLIKEISSKTIKSETNIEQNKGNSKISEWLKPEIKEEVVEHEINLKYIILLGIIAGALSYYYWDDITPHISTITGWGSSLWAWLRRRGDGPGDPGNTANRERLRQEVREKINRRWDEVNNIKGKAKASNDTIKPEELEDKTSYLGGHKNIISTLPPEDNPIKSPVLTSPSLDDLNSKVEDLWSRPTSPSSSTSSTSTIKPINLPNIPSTSESNIENLGLDSLFSDEDPVESVIYMITPKKGGFIDANKLKHASEITTENWKDNINSHTLNQISIVEDFFNNPKHASNFSDMSNKFADVLESYNWIVEYYIKHPDMSERKRKLLKDLSSHMRIWINDNYWRVYPKDFKNVASGKLSDSPRKSVFELLEDIE